MKKIALISVGLITLIAVVLGWQYSEHTQQRVYRVAMVQLTEVDHATVIGFKQGLHALGWQEGVNIIYFDDGPAGSIDKLDSLIKRHLQRQPDLIFSSSTSATLAAKRLSANSGIPLLFAPVNDPIAAGIVSNLQKPDGNLSGIRLPTGDDLRLRWLNKIAPNAKYILIPYSPADKSAQASLITVRHAAKQLNLVLYELPVHQVASLAQLLQTLPNTLDGVFLPRDSTIEAQIDIFVKFCHERHLPLAAPSLLQVRAGALFSYGFVHNEIGRQAARLAHQIFTGTLPAHLPIEMAENYLAINLASAKIIGLDIPAEILMHAEFILETNEANVRLSQ
jgi:putative tryptophan/tyrosine transport system substrate-binding protein